MQNFVAFHKIYLWIK